MKSPQRFFFLIGLVCLLVGLFMERVGSQLAFDLLHAVGPQPVADHEDLSLARYYLSTGQPARAIEQFETVIPNLEEGARDAIRQDIEALTALQSRAVGQIAFFLIHLQWSWPPRLYVLAALFGLLFIGAVLIRVLGKKPLFAILPFADYSGLNIGEDLQRVALDRMREIVWRTREMDSANSLITENLEIPTLGMVSEGDSIDAVALLETALFFSTGVSDLPLARLFSSLQLWFEQPRFLVRGFLEENEGVVALHMQLIARASGKTLKVWRYESNPEELNTRTEIIDAVIYPLMFHFTEGMVAAHWQAFQSLHHGIESFLLFKEHQNNAHYLNQAQQHIEKALTADPAYRFAHYNLGLIQLTAGDYEHARHSFLKVMQMPGEDRLGRWGTYNYGVALFHISQDWAYERAADTFQTLLEDAGDEGEDLFHLTKSSLAATYAKMANRHKKRKTEFAQEAFQMAAAVLEDPAASREARANAGVAQGYAFLALRDFDRARQSFLDSTGLNPASAPGFIGLGEAYVCLKASEKALRAFQQAADVSPFGAYAHYRLGNVYRDMKDLDKAVEAYQKAPGLAVACLALGKIHLEGGHHSRALENFRTATTINRRLSEAWVNIAWTILEMEEETLLREAELAARRAIQLERNARLHWHRHAVLARCLYEQGKLEPAQRAAHEAVRLDPTRAQAYYYLAQIQVDLGHSRQAHVSIMKTRELDPQGIWHARAESLLEDLTPLDG